MSHGDGKGDRDPWREREAAPNAWGILLFGLLGATAATVAVGQLRRTIDWFYIQLSRSQSCSSWRNATNNANHGGFREEAWRKYQQRMQEKYEEESERVERIRRMQNVFSRKRNEYMRSHRSWMENDPGAYHHSPHDDWYYKADTSFREQTANYKFGHKHSGSDSLSHHYSILGLDWSRAERYSDDEIKRAFREKAMELHPDQNQDKKEVAEAKFKEVMMSYEAIKLERSNGRS